MAVGALLGGVLLAAAHTHALPPQGRSIAAMRRPALAARTSSPFMKQNSPAALRGGSAEGAPASDDTARPENTAGDTALTTLLLALWYASSIVNNQSSKVLVSLLGAEVLTLNQLLISAGCGTLVLRQSPLRFDSRPHLTLTATLAASFLAGCYTLNSCLASMHVSLAMVLRSAEPLTTLALGAMLLPAKEQPPLRKALALLPVVLGCGLSAVGPHGPTATSLVLVAISNVCFSLRAILGRQLKAAHGTGPVRLFSQMSLIAAGLQALVLGGRALFSPVAVRAELTGAATVLAARPVLAALNGLGFYAQLQLSFVCLSRMSALSHSLANSMRRPVTIVAALAFAPALLTPANWAGVALACMGALIYGVV